MDESKLKDFLKEYVNILKEQVDISNDLPLTTKVSMPGGCVEIHTKDGTPVGYITIGGCEIPSMPVLPVTLTYADLFVKLINKFGEMNNVKRK